MNMRSLFKSQILVLVIIFQIFSLDLKTPLNIHFPLTHLADHDNDQMSKVGFTNQIGQSNYFPLKILTPDPNNNTKPQFPSTSTPTPIIGKFSLGGTVLEQASCRYGPGAAYLFEWGLFAGDEAKIISRNSDYSWLYIKPNTYNNQCWIRADLIEVNGDITFLDEYYSPLPQGYLYKPVHYVVAKRTINLVRIEWEQVWMTLDDDRGYLIEAWVCQDGKNIFLPINIFPYSRTSATILDEPGCLQRSRAKIYTVEKHGYLKPVWILWPKFSNIISE